MASNKVYVHVQKRIQTMVISSDDSVADVYNLFASAALINAESTSLVLKLYDQDGNLIPIGPNIQPNTPETAYRLKIKLPSNKVLAESEGIELVNEINSLSERISDLQTEILNNKISNNAVLGPGITSSPAITRVNDILQKVDIQEAHKLAKTGFTFTPQVLTELKQTNFDVWAYDDIQMIGLFHEMFKEFNLMETFNILEMYCILHETNIHSKFSLLEKFTLVISCIGHDLDHPGFNNAYQINASTDLAIIYNDISPLENHHAAVLFAMLRHSSLDVCRGLTESESREFRRDSVSCILATDMARHGDILNRFKAICDSFKFEDETHRKLLMQMIIKCSDISNEVRPQKISEPWVDNLLVEFFNQSDREKLEGLPTAPFMDRQKVTKPSAQVGFIGFVMIPLFELAGKVLPNFEAKFLTNIREALKFYKGMMA